MTNKEEKTLIFVGLGNPGKKYELTRHNVGNLAVQAAAHKLGLTFKPEKQLNAELAKGKVNNCQYFLVLPTTYMNESGRAVRKILDYYKLSVEDLVIVVDDIAIDFGELRLRKSGSSGGHNGLKDIQAHLGTSDYKRLRIGIGRHGEQKTLTEHVLQKFNKDELAALSGILDEATNALLLLQTELVDNVMNKVNMRNI